MKFSHLKILHLVVVILGFSLAKAQVISGTVSDSSGPLPGVNVVVMGTTIGTQTDFDGNFTLKDVPIGAKLFISFIGYKTHEVVFNGETHLNFILEENQKLIEEVVLVGYGTKSKDSPDDVPQFPWPPPSPSAKILIPAKAFTGCKYLGDVNNILTDALTQNGYVDKAYFLVPSNYKNGFAMATQLEQIDDVGFSKKPPNRWNVNMIDNSFSFKEYISALLFPNPGYFRVFVFIVTDIGFIPDKRKKVNRRIAMSWLDTGAIGFPEKLRNVMFTEDHKVIALVYEYELKENEEEANLKKPSKHTGQDHLIKSNLWSVLNKQ